MDDSVQIETRTITADAVSELYVTATPTGAAPVAEQAHHLFGAVRDVLTASGARLFHERVFATEDAFATLMPIRARTYGRLDDAVPPAMLAVPEGATGALAGVQVHAVAGVKAPQPILLQGTACGRRLTLGDRQFVTLSGLSSAERGTAPDQAQAMLQDAARILRDVGGDMRAVARTWMWLGDILAWYDAFNDVRTRFFNGQGLIDRTSGRVRFPASTGIGVAPAGGAACAMDLFAVVGAEDAISFLLAGGRQQPAYDYGSAFSRASRSVSPAGETIFVSGTAAIDTSGATVHVGDPAGQIEATLANVRAILDAEHCRDEDVVQAIVYCKTPEVERLFRQRWAEAMPWPQITAQADVCRDDLLFEIEATAVRPAGRRE